MSGTVTTINTPVTGASGPSGSGAAGQTEAESAGPFSNENFASLGATLQLFPRATGGAGASGAIGINGASGMTTITEPQSGLDILSETTDWSPGGAGGGGGNGGNGGGATIDLARDALGTVATPYASSFTLNALATGGASNGGGYGGSGGYGGLNSQSTGTNPNDGTTYPIYVVGATGGSGGAGGDGGPGGAASATLDGFDAVSTGGETIGLTAIGGAGGPGSALSLSGGNGAIGGEASAGGLGGAGSTGGDAAAMVSGSTISDTGTLSLTVGSDGGAGGMGGAGGQGGPAETRLSGVTQYAYGTNGDGGAGGGGGNAAASVTGSSLTSPTINFNVFAKAGAGGAGGAGGNEGNPVSTATMKVQVSAPGATGAAAGDGGGAITFTGNTVTVGSAHYFGVLQLGLDIATAGSGGTPVALNGGTGGNLAFSGNVFQGSGTSSLELEVGGGGVTVDASSNTIAIDGSAANSLTGFTSFFLDKNDVFVGGSSADSVYINTDPDTVVITPSATGALSIYDSTPTSLVLDFAGLTGFGSLGALMPYVTQSGGNTMIALPQLGPITLVGYTSGLSASNVVFSPQCFAAGTRIRTPDGDVAVERLAVGGLVCAERAGDAAIVFVGHRHIDCAAHPRPETVWPVRIAPGAFAAGVPARALLLSPDHAVYEDGVLIPVKYLINGTTIAQERVAAIDYYHIELAGHDLLLAEGLLAESLLPGDRATLFPASSIRLHPRMAEAGADAWRWEAAGCAPLVIAGPAVDRTRARLGAG